MTRLFESGLVDYIAHYCYPNAITVYGSYAKGEDIEESDIDIFILTRSIKNLKLENFEAILKKRVHVIMKETLKDTLNLKIEIINGIVIYGYLKI